MRTKARACGFTLVELLVAIAVMALLAIVSWRGLDGMVRAQQQTRERADAVLALQTIMDQWGADLDALQAVERTEPMAWDGQVLRLTRRSMRQPDEGAVVVAWALRSVDGQAQWLRWQSAPVRTRGEWTDAWTRAAQWARTPSTAERRQETVLMPLAGWQLFFYRGGAWANALSTNTAGSQPQTPGGLGNAAASIPDGVRLQLTLPEGGALSGVITRDWVSPLLGGGKS
ncbi:MAG: prepilin-type N-terminal cleavage/methylation domain-containing protein [Proteobacteria bacterium]|nr:prepilin-type N-terminal cleavage/methylation domain-containing protein [Pseudomonadota bacterium]